MRGAIILLALCITACVETGGRGPWTEGPEVERGEAVSTGVFKALSTRLQAALEEGGPVHAVEYCSLHALPIMDSLASGQGVSVKRTSDRLRAPHNAPDAHETARLHEALAWIAAGMPPAELPPQAFAIGDSIFFYKPLLLASPQCLTCHGSHGGGLDSLAHLAILDRYPDDRATGYSVGELRGLWSIRWRR